MPEDYVGTNLINKNHHVGFQNNGSIKIILHRY